MEPSLGLGGGGGTGGGGVGLSIEQTAKMEKDYMGMSKEAELELGLGLSLGNSGGGAAVVKGKGSAWGEYGRILTAKDFPNGFPCGTSGAVNGGGTKRERAATDGVDEGCTAAAVREQGSWRNENNEKSNKKINHGNDKNDAALKERGHLGFVKVNMDGLPIGRKVDLNAHKSYETLAKNVGGDVLQAVLDDPCVTYACLMLAAIESGGGKEQSIQPPKLLDGSSEFVLTYEDKEGDWMLVGDVPWGMFFNTVKRLRIMRTSEANGLGLLSRTLLPKISDPVVQIRRKLDFLLHFCSYHISTLIEQVRPSQHDATKQKGNPWGRSMDPIIQQKGLNIRFVVSQGSELASAHGSKN
ncbi:hypothetical protein DH2020_004583 [Rehmannia glutinosa]|uniref:Auxin-responsive protein n=1 Tax=Rehmannia glutinosa TaxID=99300 RepID=A0ABR0XPW5_REHGL